MEYINNMKKVIIGIVTLSIIVVFSLTLINKDEKSKIKNTDVNTKQSIEHDNDLVTKKTTISIKTQELSKEVIKAKKDLENLKIEKLFEERKKQYMKDFQKKNQIINIEKHYIDEDQKIIQPYKEINEENVGWSPNEIPYFDDPIMPVNYYYPIEFLSFEDMIFGVENGFIKEFKLKRANQEDSMIYSKCEIDEGQYSFHLNCYNGADGYLNLHAEKETNNIVGNFSYFGRNEVIITRNGKGYIYGVYK